MHRDTPKHKTSPYKFKTLKAKEEALFCKTLLYISESFFLDLPPLGRTRRKRPSEN
jgi:hypothetical protein